MEKRFELFDNIVVVDHQTGLMWQAAHTQSMTWDQAKDYATKLDCGGFKNWRLPTIEELITLINFKKHSPASDFPNMPLGTFWSSSSNVYYPTNAWNVNFYYGYVDNFSKANSIVARCVRSVCF